MKKLLLLAVIALISLSIYGQNRLLKGKIADPSTGEPLAGVSIYIEGTTTGTITDLNGNYSIEAPIGSTIVVNFVGYVSEKFVVTPEKNNKTIKDTTIQVEPMLQPKPKVFHHSIPDDPAKTISPYFFIQSDDPTTDKMPLKSTSAEVNIAGVIADITIRQVYINEGKNVLEAIYIFPGSTRAAVYSMNMTIGNRKLTAKIKEKQQARQEYEQAKQDGKTATLLEQKRPNVFQMNVANILPGDTITVEMKYTELLEYTKGIYEFVHPTVVGPRYSNKEDNEANKDDKWIANPYQHEGNAPVYSFNLKTKLNAGMPIKDITSPSHKINFGYTGKDKADINLDPTEEGGGNRDFILRYRLSGNKVESGLLLYEHGDENFFLLMMQPPKAPTIDQIPPREYVFIVDVSGSMSGFPLSVSKELMRNLLSQLRETDKFNILLFAGSNNLYSPSSLPATEENINDGIRFVDKQHGGGGTEIYPAMKRALNLPTEENSSRIFVALTDGYVGIEKELFQMIRNNLNNTNVFAVGIGTSVNRYLIEGIANAGMGEAYVVTNAEEAEKIGTKFRDYVEKPVLTHISYNFKNFDAYDIQPEIVPDVFAERPIILVGKYHGNPLNGSISIKGKTGDENYSKVFAADSASFQKNQALRYLWARTKIRYLDDYAKYDNGEYPSEDSKHQHQKEVTNIGLKYSILTNYTSFIAVDSLIRNVNKPITTVNQPLPLPKGVSDLAIGKASQANDPNALMLVPDVKKLEEVVVIGYGTQKKSDITSAVTSVSAKELSGSGSTISQALQGRATGVSVIPASGRPGGNSTVVVRGNSSMLSGEPLYLIDGVPVNAANGQNISASNIESLEIIKDASSTAIYGSRGSNGVIAITTKKGKAGKIRIDFNSTSTVESVNKLPAMQTAYAQGRPVNGALTWQGADSNEPFSWGPALNQLMFDGQPYAYDKNGRLIPKTNSINASAQSYDPKKFFTTGFSFINSLSISKGNEKRDWHISLLNKQKTDVIPGSKETHNNISFNANQKLSKRFRLSASGTYQNGKSDFAASSSDISAIMYGLFTNPPSFDMGNGLSGKKAIDNESAYLLSNRNPRNFSSIANNPYWTIANSPFKDKNQGISGFISCKFEIVQDLNLSIAVNHEEYNNHRLFGANINSAGLPDGKFIDRTEKFETSNVRSKMEFSKNLNRSQIEFSLGNELFTLKDNIEKITGTNLNIAGLYTTENANSKNYLIIDKSRTGNRLFGSVRFNLNDIYIINASLSKDWSTTLKNSAGLSMATGMALKLSNLSFMHNNPIISNAKIYVNIGRTIKETQLLNTSRYFKTSSFSYSETSTFFNQRENIMDPNLKPESVTSVSVGLNLGLFGNRMTIDGNFYNRINRNAVFAEIIDDQTSSLKNMGTIRNYGIEMSADYNTHINELNVKSKINITVPRNKVIDLQKEMVQLAGFDDAMVCALKGQPLGVIYGTNYQRNEEGKLIIGTDGFPIVDTKMSVIGNPNPHWIANFENTLSWHNWDFSFLLEWKKGGDIWNGTRNTMSYFGTSGVTGELRNTQGYIFDGARTDGSVNTTPVNFADPTKALSENRWVRYGISGVAEDAIEDGSWFRVRELKLTYNVSRKFSKKLKMDGCSLSFYGRNLFLHTAYKGVDPETSLTGADNGVGLDYFNSPLTKSIGVMLNIKF